jgi:hypothetical protein
MDHAETEHIKEAEALPQQWHVMACIRTCGGDHLAGLVLSQLLYWWPRKGTNHKGIKKSFADWKDELMLGRKPVERINAVLVKLGFVEIYQDKWGHFKSPSTFYVLTEKALALIKAPAPKVLMVSEAPAPKVHVVFQPLVPKVQVTETTKSLTENTKSNTKSAQALPDAILTGETSKAPQGKTKAKAKTGDLKISVKFEALFKKEFPTLYMPLKTTDREILGSALHALHDAGEEDYEGCLLFAATAYGCEKFQGLCNAAGVFPHLKSFPEPKRIRENLGYLRQAYHSHLEYEVQKAAAQAAKVAAQVVKPAPKEPVLTYKQKTLKNEICGIYAAVKKSGEPIPPEIEDAYLKIQGPLADAEWEVLYALVYQPKDLSTPTEPETPKHAAAPTEPAPSTPAEAVAPTGIPEQIEPAAEPLITSSYSSVEDRDDFAASMIAASGGAIKWLTQSVSMDTVLKYTEQKQAEAAKQAEKDAKKPKTNIHA